MALCRVTVEDTNENAPVFDMTSYSASLEENLPAGTVVTRVSIHHSKIPTHAKLASELMLIFFASG